MYKEEKTNEIKNVAVMASSQANETGHTSIEKEEFDSPSLASYITRLNGLYSSLTQRSTNFYTPQVTEESRKKDNESYRKRLNYSDKQRQRHYASKLKEYSIEIDDTLTELCDWRSDFITWEERIPNQRDYEQKINAVKDLLRVLFPKLNPDSLFREGVNDTARCGQILIKMEKSWQDNEEEQAVCLLYSLQWLMSMQAKDCVCIIDDTNTETQPTNVPPKKESTVNEAIEILYTKYLRLNSEGTNTKIGERNWNKTRILVASMHVLGHKGTLPTDDEKAYAKLVAPFIDADAENLRKNINRVQQEIKPFECNLKDLNEDYIKNNPPESENAMTRKKYKDNWKGAFELIDGLIETMDDLAPLRKKSAQ